MAVKDRFISNQEAAPIVETDIFAQLPDKRFALLCLGRGLTQPQADPNIVVGYLGLRKNVYVDQTRMIPPDSPNVEGGIESDLDDERSTHFVVAERSADMGTAAIVACMRLIHREGKPLPIEEFFSEVFEDGTAPVDSIEVSRFISCVDGKRERLISISEMFRSGVAHIEKHKLGPVYGVVEPELERSLRFLGAPPKRIADPKMIEEYNDHNVGIEVDIPAMVKAMGRKSLLRTPTDPGSVRYWHDVNPEDNMSPVALQQRYTA